MDNNNQQKEKMKNRTDLRIKSAIKAYFKQRNSILKQNNSISENYKLWNEIYTWERDGEEWSTHWGCSYAQWNSTILPRIINYLPVKTLLEIAPGHGRWTKYLIPYSQDYIGVDLSDQCIEFCKKRFQNEKNLTFFVNDGLNLSMIESQSCDFIFSFDSLVHVNFDVLKSYISEILRILKPSSGVAFIHHSNAGEFAGGGGKDPIQGWRAIDVTASLVSEYITSLGGSICIQEKVNWEEVRCIDCFTIFSRQKLHNPIYIENPDFMLEAKLCKKYINRYYIENL
jgi:SAM-dependent methyltransferase